MYLRIIDDDFGFYDEISKEDNDIKISDEDYNKFFEEQSNGKQYRLKETRQSDNSGGLFDYVEEYTQQQENIIAEPTLEERITALESAFLESM